MKTISNYIKNVSESHWPTSTEAAQRFAEQVYGCDEKTIEEEVTEFVDALCEELEDDKKNSGKITFKYLQEALKRRETYFD